MNFKNFKIAELLTEIESDGKFYELHNDADLYGVEYLVSKNEVTLIWEYPGSWFRSQKKGTFNSDYLVSHNIDLIKKSFLALNFKKISNFSIKGKDSESFVEDDKCLFSIEKDFIDGKEGLLFQFGSGMEIRIEANEVFFECDYKS